MMSIPTSTLYPPGGFGAPKNRRGHADNRAQIGHPPGTEVLSADNHISLAADIFYELFPDDQKEQAPRIWYEDGAYMVGHQGQSFVVGDFRAVLMRKTPNTSSRPINSCWTTNCSTTFATTGTPT